MMSGGRNYLCCPCEENLCDPSEWCSHPDCCAGCGGGIALGSAVLLSVGTIFAIWTSVIACDGDMPCRLGVAWGILTAYILLVSFLIFVGVSLIHIASRDTSLCPEGPWPFLRDDMVAGAAVIGFAIVAPIAIPLILIALVFVAPCVIVFACGVVAAPLCRRPSSVQDQQVTPT